MNKVKNLKQVVFLKAPISKVYQSLVDSKIHSKITDSKVVIGKNPGSKFTVWDWSVNGINILFVPNTKIVQAWRIEDWEPGHYSLVCFNFSSVKDGTQITFEQYGIPVESYKSIRDGWKNYYWKSMSNFFNPNLLNTKI